MKLSSISYLPWPALCIIVVPANSRQLFHSLVDVSGLRGVRSGSMEPSSLDAWKFCII
jgi:hypothetical protein